MNSRFAFQIKGARGRADLQTADRKQHWERVWRGKEPEQVSWFQPHLKTSLALITQAALPSDAPIIDVGGGASTLVDSLLALGFRDLTVLDIAAAAIGHAKARLGKRAEAVRWIVGDVTAVGLSGGYDVWHDRAVFHFLTEEKDRRAYVRALRSALRPGGQVILATFGPDGPQRCSGLPVVRYGADEVIAVLGSGFSLMQALTEVHTTPAGSTQQFQYVRLVFA